MLPADTVLRAAARWLRILQKSSLAQAWGLIRADPAYADITSTQYASALDWLHTIGLVIDTSGELELSEIARRLPEAAGKQLLFERSLQYEEPAWLRDSDVWIQDVGELPQDALGLAESLGLNDEIALLGIRHAHGRVDLERRAQVGLAGEQGLLDLLEHMRPGSTTHIAKTDDGYGYDILLRDAAEEWHLEVKTTTRHGRLVIYVSRNEHEVGMRDPRWQLVIVGLDSAMRPAALATVKYAEIATRVPRDSCPEARWESTSYELGPSDLQPGLSFVASPANSIDPVSDLIRQGSGARQSSFEWLPDRCACATT